MCVETYNGWANRETWALMLYVRNDEDLNGMLQDMAVAWGSVGEPGAFGRDQRVASLAAAVEQVATSLFTRAGYVYEFSSVWPDELQDAAADIGSLWRVDWRECAESLLGDAS